MLAIVGAAVIGGKHSQAAETAATTILLHHQYEQELPAAYLRAFNHKRAAFAQLCVGLE